MSIENYRKLKTWQKIECNFYVIASLLAIGYGILYIIKYGIGPVAGKLWNFI